MNVFNPLLISHPRKRSCCRLELTVGMSRILSRLKLLQNNSYCNCILKASLIILTSRQELNFWLGGQRSKIKSIFCLFLYIVKCSRTRVRLKSITFVLGEYDRKDEVSWDDLLTSNTRTKLAKENMTTGISA